MKEFEEWFMSGLRLDIGFDGEKTFENTSQYFDLSLAKAAWKHQQNKIDQLQSELNDQTKNIKTLNKLCASHEKRILDDSDKIEELQKQLDNYTSGHKGACSTCEPVGELNIELQKQLGDANEQLKFYARTENWDHSGDLNDDDLFSNIVMDDTQKVSICVNKYGGKRAREYCEKYKYAFNQPNKERE